MRKKYLILVIMFFIVYIGTVAYATYTSIKLIETTSESGKIVLNDNDKQYIIYELNDDEEVDTEVVLAQISATNNDDYFIRNGMINTYASRKVEGSSYEQDYIQLNQLGFKFSFKTTIDVYVRIRIEDAWLSTKYYRNGTTISQVILKDVNSLKSAINTNEWHYDDKTGYIYFHEKISKSEETYEMAFRFSRVYYYQLKEAAAFKESVSVQVSYEVDIVQANRAEKKWGVDVEKLFSGGN